MSVAEYMELCVSHYYANNNPFGKEGDFITAPEISQIFGELIGAWLQNIWQSSLDGQAILCEVGPGRGTLMRDALRATKNSEFHKNIDICLIETSHALRGVQAERLQVTHPRISWHNTLDNLPSMPLFLIANEFFDALPIRQYLENNEERKIITNENTLSFSPDGKVTREESPASVSIMKQIAEHIKKYGGAALIIDYGYTTTTHGDSLQAMKNHKYVEPLQEPGEADITAHVDFTTLKNAAAETGSHVWGAVEQGTFLNRLGAELRAINLCKSASDTQQKEILSGLERLTSPHQMGTLFKVLAITSDGNKPIGF